MKIAIAILSTILLIGFATPLASAQNVPEWVKDNAGAWANNEISTELYVTGLQYLIDEGVITIPPTSQGQGTENTIPEWVKDNAGSWANNDISTELYVTGLQYLIEQGVMKIKNEQPAKQSVKDAKLASLEEQLEQCSEIIKAYSRIQCEKEAEAKILRYEYETTGTAYKVGPITYYYSGNEFEISDQGQALLTLKLLAVNTDSTDNVTLMCTGPAICNYDVTNGDKIFKYASTDFTSGSITLKPDGSKEFEMFFGPNIGYGGTKFEYDPNKDYYFRINESFGSTSIPLNLG